MFVFMDGNLAEVKGLLIPLDVPMDFEQKGRVGKGGWGVRECPSRFGPTNCI